MQAFIAALLLCFGSIFINTANAKEHDIVFCGEMIPVSNDFVATKLMNVIKSQIPNANLPSLRARANDYFPYVESYLRREGLPTDFKYLPIVESGFNLVSSRVGAAGFWQLMPETARGLGLVVNESIDERNDIEKATKAACQTLRDYYNFIKRRHGRASWVLTAAAYNWGIGNISKAINNQGQDYFSMNLNPETAAYVYKIIAVKELWEYPEQYMSGFGYNVFKVTKKEAPPPETIIETPAPSVIFQKLDLTEYTHSASEPEKLIEVQNLYKTEFKGAYIKKNYKHFKDGDLVEIVLQEDLLIPGSYTEKGTITGKGWLIDDRIYVDLGFGKYVAVFDSKYKKGIAASMLKKDEPVLLKIETYKDDL
jgi:membrane-bound lytic murein transglycosylase D